MKGMKVDYLSYLDHNKIGIKIHTMKIEDHTNYPKTLNPTIPRTGDDIEINKLILGREEVKGEEDNNMMEISMLLFHFPLERNCPLSKTVENKDFDKVISMDLRFLKLNFLMEYLFRIKDYVFSQLIGALSDSDPYSGITKRVDKET
jgi:hypothetical protein